MMMSWTSRLFGKAGIVLGFAALMVAGCADKRNAALPYEPSGFVAPDPAVEASQSQRIGPGDLVNVVVYRAADVSGDFRVDAAGNITMPLVGQIRALGMTPDELAATLKDQLGRKYYENPSVAVTLKESPAQKVTVDGAVQAPGVYPIQGKTTLMQAVAMARGTTEDANLRRVVVFRQVGGQRMVAAFDLKAIRTAQMADPEVFGSDIVVVDGNSVKKTWKDVITTIPVLSVFRVFY